VIVFPFSKFDVFFDEKKIEVKVSEHFEKIVNVILKNGEFTFYELEEFVQIKSTYAKTMYRHLKQWRTTGKAEFPIERFREMLDVPESYTSGEVTRRVVFQIMKELSPFFEGLKYEVIKGSGRGTPIKSYVFKFKKQSGLPYQTENVINTTASPKPKKTSKKTTKKTNVPDYYNPDYKNETPEETKVELEYDSLVFKNNKVYTKYYRPNGVTPKSLLIDSYYGRTESGNDDIKRVFGSVPFSYPKPLFLISHFLEIGIDKDSAVLDFFSGSATTAHSVMQLNAEDGGNRKYIMVQLPEMCDEDSEAYKAGYKNICEIGKERIRRAGEKIKSDESLPIENREKLDVGFKVFKLDSTNIKEWDTDTENLQQSLLDSIENIKRDRNTLDVLYEILLKYGLDLNIPIEENKDFYSIGGGSLLVSLNREIDDEVIDSICKEYRNLLEIDKEFKTTVILRDNSFKDDEVKTNAIKKLEQVGISEIRSI